MDHILKIKGSEYLVPFIRFRDRDPRHGSRSTVTIVTDLEYAVVVALFSEPGEWSHIMRYEPKTDTDGNVHQEPGVVKDYTEYDRLLSIRDNRCGVLEVVMGKITAEEALEELREVLEG